MQRFNLSVAVMYDNEPMMYLYSKDFDRQEVSRFVLCELKNAFPTMEFVRITGTDLYAEYECKPDKEVGDDVYLLAIWQEVQ